MKYLLIFEDGEAVQLDTLTSEQESLIAEECLRVFYMEDDGLYYYLNESGGGSQVDSNF